jgi:hypothetical protein
MAIDLSPLSPTVYAQTDFGRYVNEASTLDEPIRLAINSTLKSEGESSFVVRFDEHKNSEVGMDDDHLAVYLVTRGNMRVFGPADIRAYIEDIVAITEVANLEKILRGQR